MVSKSKSAKKRGKPGKKRGAPAKAVNQESSPCPEPPTPAPSPSQIRETSPPLRGRRRRDSGESRLIPVPTQNNDQAQRRHTKHRMGALSRLGIGAEQLRGVPRISHILDHAEGGLVTVVAALRLCEDPDGIKFLDKYDSLSATDLDYVTVEDICVAAGVHTKRLLELAVSALVEDGESSGKIIAATYHPRVIRATAISALGYDGYNDRKLFLGGTGFMPQPANRSGGVFQVQINNQALAVANAGDSDGANIPVQAEDDLKVLHEAIDGTKLLEAPKTVESPTSVQIGHQYRDQAMALALDGAPDREMSCIPSPK